MDARSSEMGGQPGKPKPLGNPPIRQEPQQPQPIEEPPRPLPVPPVERPPLPMQASNSTYINAENAATGLGECEWPPHRQGESTGGTYVRRRQSTTWSKSATKQRLRNGAFTTLEPRAANRSRNRFAKSGARVRVDCQSSEPAFVKLLISADLQSTRQAGSSRLLPSRSIL
jgi:hypothetical protein